MSARVSISRPLRYHLRFQIIPGPHIGRDISDLIAFCQRHKIDEVVVFFAAEEWNNGLLSRKDEDRWFAAVKSVKAALDRAGITASLNPWMTDLHCDRGRRFPADRQFQPAVSPAGRASRACASFADPAWRQYVYNLYARFAELGFRVLWLEDDFRYHNHEPLDWGSGFEPPVLERFSKMIGRRITRRQVVRAILKPGRPHPWRTLWMKNWREIQLEVVRGLAQAVRQSTPVVSRLGLMSSYPPIHSVEGRDWHALFAAMSINGRVTHRPHFAGYSEAPGRQKTYSIMMLDIQKTFRPADCEVAPEIENFPFTRWSKSDSLTWAEMALCQFHGSDALLLDLFPFSANPASREPQIGELLDRSRPGLEWIASRFSSTLRTRGVGLPWKQHAQAHVRTSAGLSMTELNASPFGPGEYLLPYGIATSATPQNVNAIFGSLAWALSDAEIRDFLSAGLLLDADSADILQQRGFGGQIGAKIEEFVGREDLNYSLEAVVSGQSGAPTGHFFNMNLPRRIARLHPRRGAKEWTSILTADGKYFGPAITTFRNTLGGRVAVLAAPNPAELPRCYHRQRIAHRLVDFLAGGRFAGPLVAGEPYCLPMHFAGPQREAIVIFNGSPDPARPVVRLPKSLAGPKHATLLAPLCVPEKNRVKVRAGRYGKFLDASLPVPYLGFLVLEW